MNTNSLADRARFARERAGFPNEAAAAKAIGCSRTLVISWENGTAKSIGSTYLLAAARAYQVRPEWLTMAADDDGFPWAGAPPPPQKLYAYEVRAVEDYDGIDPNTDVMVEEVDVLLNGGPGNLVPEFIETKYQMPFQLSWFQKHRAKPENVKLMRVNGHSMERTLYDGDRVAVHLADTRIRDGRVYALAIGHEAKVKRLYTLRDGSIRITSDNSDKETYPDEIVPVNELDTIFVLGRVIDKSGSGGL